jgi:ribosome-associated protein
VIEHLSDINLRRALALRDLILKSLDDHKAFDVEVIPLAGKSDVADFMVIASGTSNRHVGALADHAAEAIRKSGISEVTMEGKEDAEWVVLDTPYLVIHLFKPEVRSRYSLEKMWRADFTEIQPAHVY